MENNGILNGLEFIAQKYGDTLKVLKLAGNLIENPQEIAYLIKGLSNDERGIIERCVNLREIDLRGNPIMDESNLMRFGNHDILTTDDL